MGNKESSKLKDAEQKARDILDELKMHRKLIRNIAHTVNSQNAHVEQLLKDVSELGEITEKTSWGNIEGTDFAEKCRNFTRNWQKNTKVLLGSVQSSLECEIDSLLMSFKRLNQNIFDTFNSYGVEFCSSDDTNIDRKVLEYENSPQVDYQSAYRKLCKTSGNELGKLENKNKQLSEEIRKTRNEMKEQLDNEKETSKKVEERMHQCKEENTELAAKMKVLEKRLSELEANKISARNIIEELKRDKERLEGNLKDLKEHRPVSIQLYYQVKGDMTSKMLEALKSMLVTQMGVERNELQFIVCQNELDVNPELPLLVFCISASRLGTDASTVLQNLNVSAKVSVLIFHHKDIHALPNQSSERVLTGPEFKALGGIFDIAFLSDKGIYPCDMNQTAAVGIESFLRTQS